MNRWHYIAVKGGACGLSIYFALTGQWEQATFFLVAALGAEVEHQGSKR